MCLSCARLCVLHMITVHNQPRLAFTAVQCTIHDMSLHAQVSALMRQVLAELAEGAGRQRAKLLLDAFKQTDERRRAQFSEVTPKYLLIMIATAHGCDTHSPCTPGVSNLETRTLPHPRPPSMRRVIA